LLRCAIHKLCTIPISRHHQRAVAIHSSTRLTGAVLSLTSIFAAVASPPSLTGRGKATPAEIQLPGSAVHRRCQIRQFTVVKHPRAQGHPGAHRDPAHQTTIISHRHWYTAHKVLYSQVKSVPSIFRPVCIDFAKSQQKD
jgi:hypothetical protein